MKQRKNNSEIYKKTEQYQIKNGLKVFESAIVKKISINIMTLQVTISQKTKVQLKQGQDLFTTYFNSKDFKILQSIEINGCPLVKLQKIEAPCLYQIKILNSQIQCLDLFALSELSSLKQIKITSKSIIQLPKFNAFLLQRISISSHSNPYLLIVKEFCEGKYPSLMRLQFSNSKMCAFSTLKNFPQLLQLDISGNEIHSLAQFASGYYPSLKIIKAMVNQIVELPQFPNCPAIQELEFSYNKIQNIQAFSNGKYSMLKWLNLRSNRIENVPSIQAQNLEHISLFSNKISLINKLAELKYQKLQYISVAENLLEKIPFINAPFLNILDVGNNKFGDLQEFYQEGIMKYQHLESLYCGQNLIRQIPVFLTFKNLQHLKKLYLSCCMIENIEILSQIQLNDLKWIDLSQNKINSFNIFHKLKLPSIQDIRFLRNLSYTRHSMARCQIGQLKYEDQQKDIRLYQDTNNGCYNLNWTLKYFQEGINLNIGIDYRNNLGQGNKFSEAFDRKAISREQIQVDLIQEQIQDST